MPALNIAAGSVPDWNTQVNNPVLFNMFIGSTMKQYATPGLIPIASFDNAIATHYTAFNDGQYITVEELNVWRVSPTGSKDKVGQIPFSSNTIVELTENLQRQVTITGSGVGAYVLDQINSDTFTQLGADQGFAITNPISCTTINGITIVLGADGVWQISLANNSLMWNSLYLQKIDSQLITALAVKTIDNNLFIFGTGGIERWEPTFNVNQYAFPFQKDQNFKNNFGALSTNAIYSDIDNIFFISSRFIPMQLSGEGLKPIAEEGVARLFGQYQYLSVRTAVYTYYSYYFFQITFPLDNVTWVYCVNSGKWANTDDFIIDAALINVNGKLKNEVVLVNNTLSYLSLPPSYKERYFISESFVMQTKKAPCRAKITCVELMITQGQDVPSLANDESPRRAELSISTDRVTFGNVVPCNIGNVGQRQAKTRWFPTVAGTFARLKIAYFGAIDYTVEGVDVTIK
jgi:hypothetical protein